MKTMKTPKSSGWLAKVSRVLIYTMLFSTFMYQGWYNPQRAEAAITNLQAWSNVYTGTAFPGTYTYTVPAGVARMLVVAVSSHPSVAATQTCTVTYGGQSLTKAITNETTSSLAHTWLFYLQQTGLNAATNTNLVVTITGGTTRVNHVHAGVYEGADQSGTPISSTANYNAANATITVGPLTAALVIGAGERGVEAVNITRTGSTAARTILTWATGWTSQAGPNSLASTDAVSFYAADDSTAASTTSQHTLNNAATNQAMSAMSIKMLPMNLLVGNGAPEPASTNAGQGTVNNALDAFTMGASAGGVSVNSVTVTGNLNFTTANIAGLNIYEDNGTVGTLDAADVLVPSSYSAITGNVTTVTFTTPEAVTTTANYLLTINIAAAASTGVSVTGRITAATGSIGTPTYGDAGSASLALQSAPGLIVGNGTLEPANANAQRTSNSALDAFTLVTANALGGTASINTLTVTGNAPNFITANISGIYVYQDNAPVGTFDVTDVLVPSTASAIAGNATTLTFSPPLYVTNTAKNYLVVLNIAAAATLNNTVTGRITAATGNGLATPTYNDTTSATLTISAKASITSCVDCHGYTSAFADGTARNTPDGAFVGTHSEHVEKAQYDCSICHITPPAGDFGHRTGNIQMNAGATAIQGGYYDKNNNLGYNAGADDTWAQTNTVTTSSCRTIACHGGNNPTPQWGAASPWGAATAGCINCHNGVVSALRASALTGGAVTQRDNAVAEFGLAYGHKPGGKTPARGAVTNADCIVCHLEGDFTTQKTSARHADGYIDLRDPDDVANGENPIKDISGNPYKFVKFSTSYAPGSRTSTGHLSNNIDNVLTQNFCLACHDSNGATNTTARTSGGTQWMPWGGVNLGATYTVLNGAAVAGGLINAKTQFATTNSSVHPVLGPRNKDLPTATRLNAPYNNQIAGRVAAGAVKTNSVVLNCFDCHTSGTSLTTRTIAAHGTNNTAQVRGTFYVTGPTLCTACHAGYTGTSNHGSGSAMNGSSDGSEGFNTLCHNCHASNTALPARPVPAADYHGYNALLSGANWPAPGARPFAFIRNTVNWTDTAAHRPFRSTEFTTGSATCQGGAGGCRVGNGSGNTRTYLPGGSY
jgi:hypothetical protein